MVKELVKAFYSSDKMSAVMNALPLALAVIAGLHSRQFLNFEERSEARVGTGHRLTADETCDII